MTDTSQQQEARARSWAMLHRQAETLLRLSQTQTAPWILAIAGVGTGAALFAAGVVVSRFVGP